MIKCLSFLIRIIYTIIIIIYIVSMMMRRWFFSLHLQYRERKKEKKKASPHRRGGVAAAAAAAKRVQGLRPSSPPSLSDLASSPNGRLSADLPISELSPCPCSFPSCTRPRAGCYLASLHTWSEEREKKKKKKKKRERRETRRARRARRERFVRIKNEHHKTTTPTRTPTNSQ